MWKRSLLGVSTISVCYHENYTVKAQAKDKKSMVAAIECKDGSTIIPWESPSHDSLLQKLEKDDFDVLVIGGGATGCGTALDAASRGLKVALVERSDFASGTSGRSTKLIHGGIRYLEQAFKGFDIAAYNLVNEALEEREHMLSAAPYMNRPLPIMIPVYKWWEVPYMYIGAKVYDIVAGKKRFVPKSYFISADEALYQYPMLAKDGLKGAIVYYDGQMNDTRMNLAIALTAAQSGAVMCNRVQVNELLKNEDGKVCGAVVQNTLTKKTFQVKAKCVVNATGPFSDGIRKMDNPNVENIVVPAAGVHVVLPDHFSPDKMGLIIPKTIDGRVLFFLPWENSTLAGTTDSVSDITMLPAPTKTEIDFILSEANRYLSKTVKRDDVLAAWSGIRPLVKDPKSLGSSTSKISREHVIETSESNLVTIAGGKWTTYRRMAEDAMNEAVKYIPDAALTASACKTKDLKMVGADRVGQVCGKKFDNITVTLREKYRMDKDVALHLMHNYGTRALQIAEISANGYLDRKPAVYPRRLLPKYPYLEAEVVFAVRQEYALKATDVIARRTRLAFIDSDATLSAVDNIVSIMGALLGWSKSRKAEEIKECKEFLATMHRTPN